MRRETPSRPRSGKMPRLPAIAGLTLVLLVPLAGCTLQLRTSDDLTVGQAISNLGQASGNAWDDIEDWFNQRF